MSFWGIPQIDSLGGRKELSISMGGGADIEMSSERALIMYFKGLHRLSSV